MNKYDKDTCRQHVAQVPDLLWALWCWSLDVVGSLALQLKLSKEINKVHKAKGHKTPFVAKSKSNIWSP